MITSGRRISVVGCSGAGKTMLSRRLAQQLGYRHIELDALFHQPGWQPLPTEQFQQATRDALQGDGWVAEGNYSAVRPLVRERSDMVIWLDLPRHKVMRQVIWRTLRRLACREELWNGNRERWSNLFKLNPRQSILAWSWTRHPVYRQRYAEEMRNAPPSCQYLRLDSRHAINAFLANLSSR
ncbi:MULTISPECIES: AAA family ATPase [Stutzerimonas stutzeri subgroup]|jgi:adenylate kinase family enzyme|uniref:Adenylate kinase n=1 Tax=Stutzerimonas stutzeri TaxID=316 RepID=A0A0D7E4C1_STUST|nr:MULTISPECIES: AAA family ATPase [Stutzerimonas stutzeri subgroup]KIZ35709.1 adenylate kinase [Stutzerimonas stutzeri]MBU0918463.1 AAA family ATPase [Gammaproteobacteria bacterium]RRU72018.1 adenylate kinase [Stutzerimonas xanthomarina]